ncbi:cyd operon YbgE family protein [Acinetobacter terrestris]|uniref:Cytochrome bd biosynthesis protein n=1 Tax=Acinetobacter terrestris TaxID=2529843 RepID=A0ABX1V0B6_9GAMM|nr:cyd operon YbgE family protein [Acinetobacter terrestris]NNH27410.1 cytochrome bd biosynthesis protein [Acinetobacter terrestris]TCB47835.1 cytochrome bd biosynthesis protein [Acinetobacter terrestris]
MTEVAITAETVKPNKFAMAISFLLALPLAAVLLIHPAMMLDANGEYSHSTMMYIMIGISGGFIHGVGFIPKFWLWKWLFGPFLAWPLMLLGYYTWLFT